MPLLRKKPFQRLHVSSDFRDNDEVFHCEVTNEIFKDFNEFCERIILCNSLIWSCSITGKSNLTYEDALESEENAKKSIKEFPLELRIPILYLAHKTNRKSFSDMIEDVYQYARDRFFVGEMVDVCLEQDTWCECHILQVIEPTEQQIKAYQASDSDTNSQERQYYPPAKLFRYEVEQMDGGDSDVSQLMTVDAGQIRRRKHQYSRERNKIFLRMLCEQNSSGVWVVKENVLQKYGILKTRFDTIFAGPLPDFTIRPKKVRQKQESIEKFLTSNTAKHRVFTKPDPLKKINDSGLIKKKQSKSKVSDKVKEELSKEKAEERKKQQRLEKQERKKKEKAYIKAWNKPREDLECEDLCLLPEPVPVNCEIPNDKFGDVVMILEFLQFFHKELKVNKYFPSGVNLELLEKALLKTEASGPWSDLLQLLLSNIFNYQEEEEDEIHADESTISDTVIDQGVSSMAEAVKLATIASTWTPNHQGCHLAHLSLDYATLTEILRQHLLASGGRIGDAASKWRYSQRGGYTNHDDPALLLRMNEARILRLLGHRSVCELDLDDKLKVISCLINQLLTFASIRDVIEERHEKINQAKKELKLIYKAEQKKEKEEREKMKEREKEGKVVEEEEQKPKKVTRNNCEEEKKKEEFETKVKELQEASKDEQMMLWLGSDRAHRRYWRFLSIPGIFVENHELNAGTCISGGTPYKPELRDKESIYAYLMSKFEEENDKENNFSGKKSPKKMFLEKNGLKSPRKDVSPRKGSKYDVNNYNELRKKIICCTGNITCPVHWMTTGGPKWSFYSNIEDIEALIQSLNKRGFRESELRENLIHEAEELRNVIKQCPTHKLNPDVFPEPSKEVKEQKSKKSKYENANLNFPADTPIDTVMELTLRDYILELEEKIRNSCLGMLKVNDREAWRKAILDGRYDKQCDKITYYDGTEIELESSNSGAVNSTLEKIKTEAKNSSRPNTPDSEVGSGYATKVYRDPGKYLGPPNKDEMTADPKQQETIRNLALAILQLSHSVEQKYLEKPLGPDRSDKKATSNEDMRDRWEQSLIASTSWSQLFVHLHTFDSSISWSKSVWNTQCSICRRRRDAENMLLCDGCNKGHHLYCLKPKLFSVPEGDWFCDKCKPPEVKPKKETKKRKKFEEEIEEEEIALTKETRHTRAKRMTNSDEDDNEDVDDEEEEEEDEEDDEEDEEYENDDEEEKEKAEEEEEEPQKPVILCSVCSNPGKIFSCDTCNKNFHLKCVTPALGRPPRGRWSCFNCKAAKYNHRNDGSTIEEKETRMTRRSMKRAVEQEEDKKSIKTCKNAIQTLLADIKQHRDSWPFMAPVTKDEVPDYHEYISHPMDFGTMQTKFESDSYETVQQFVQDCKQIFKNCEIYNRENSTVYKAGAKLLKYVEKRCKDLGIEFTSDDIHAPDAKKRKINGNSVDQNGDIEHSDDDESMKTS